MIIARAVAQARSGELNNLSSVKFSDDKIIEYINLGVIELYKRFNLATGEAIVTMRAGKTIYKLDGSDVDVNLEGPFMYIQGVYDESGEEMTVNAERDPLSILTPSYNTIQVPSPADGDVLSVIYGEEPPYATAVTDVLAIPVTLLEALLNYVGYRAHGAVDGNIRAENSTHYQRFEQSVARAKALGVVNSDDVLNTTTEEKGFV